MFVVSCQSRFVAATRSSRRLAILSERERLQVLEKQNPLSSVFQRETHVSTFFLSLSLLLLLKTTEKEMGKASVKPERETVASEDARENER